MLAVVNILAPVPEKTLHSITSRLRHRSQEHQTIERRFADLISAGKLERQVIDGSAISATTATEVYETAAASGAFPGSFRSCRVGSPAI